MSLERTVIDMDLLQQTIKDIGWVEKYGYVIANPKAVPVSGDVRISHVDIVDAVRDMREYILAGRELLEGREGIVDRFKQADIHEIRYKLARGKIDGIEKPEGYAFELVLRNVNPNYTITGAWMLPGTNQECLRFDVRSNGSQKRGYGIEEREEAGRVEREKKNKTRRVRRPSLA